MPDQIDSTAKLTLNEISRSARSAVLWLGTTTVIWQSIAWILTLYTARILDPHDYGLVALAQTIIPYLIMAVTLNLDTWIVQAEDVDRNAEGSIFSFSMILSLGIAVLSFFSASFVSNFYENDALRLPFQLLSLIFIFKGLQMVPVAMLRRDMRFKPIALMELTLGIARGSLQLVLALAGFGYWALVAGMIFREIGAAIWVIIIRGVPFRFSWNGACIKTAIVFGLHATGASILWIVFSTIDDVIVGKFFGVEILGYYSMAFFLTDLPMSKFNSVFHPVLLSYFSRLKSTSENIALAFLKISRGIAGIIFPMLVGMAVVADEGILVLLGDKWAPLVLPLRVMCFVGLFRGFTTSIGALFLALGHAKKTFHFNLFRALILPVSFYWLTVECGINGIYFTWLGIFPLTSLVFLLMLAEVIDLRPLRFFLNLRAPFFASFGMGLITFFSGQLLSGTLGLLSLLIMKIIIGVVVYTTILWLFFRKDTEELIDALRAVKS